MYKEIAMFYITIFITCRRGFVAPWKRVYTGRSSEVVNDWELVALIVHTERSKNVCCAAEVKCRRDQGDWADRSFQYCDLSPSVRIPLLMVFEYFKRLEMFPASMESSICTHKVIREEVTVAIWQTLLIP